MADVVKTCANCGNVQTAGEFCEKCGTRMPAAPTPVAPPPAPAAAPGAATVVTGAAGAAAAGATAAAGAAGAGAAHAAPQYAAAPSGQAAPRYGAPPQTPPPYGAAPVYGATPPPSYGAPRYDGPARRGFFGRLFDFSFEEFITPSIIKILFIISIVVIGLGVLGGIIFGFMASAGTGVIFLIGGLIYGFLMLLYVRVILELFIVFFRIHDNTENIAKTKR